MARTKNRGYQQILPPVYAARRWKMGGYIRLSKEDLQKINRGLGDSDSVKNQRDILNDFHFNHAEEFESYTEHVDDGHTGTDTERESFQRLLGDVMNGKITCVVVKDLSCFARNYSDAGSLIDNLFVQMGVRFISLAEGVDSYLNPDSVNSIIVPITNVMNDQYCYQTFDKVQALLVRDTWTSPKGREVHLFSGFLKCADCGKSITRSQSGENIYYENGDKAFSCFRHDDGGDLCENGRLRGELNEISG